MVEQKAEEVGKDDTVEPLFVAIELLFILLGAAEIGVANVLSLEVSDGGILFIEQHDIGRTTLYTFRLVDYGKFLKSREIFEKFHKNLAQAVFCSNPRLVFLRKASDVSL